MQERRLATIMPACRRNGQSMAGRFTDIVGYTALMGSDEDRALEVLNKYRKIHSKFMSQINGMLISFDLASNILTI